MQSPPGELIHTVISPSPAINSALKAAMRWEQAMGRRLFTDSEKESYFIRFNVEGLLRGDYESRMNPSPAINSALKAAGVISSSNQLSSAIVPFR